jgi:RND family efflux transporter MFP subunit
MTRTSTHVVYMNVMNTFTPAILMRRSFLITMIVLAAACSDRAESHPATDSAAGAAASVVLGPQDIATARLADIGGAVVLSGPLEPRDRVIVRAQVAGTIRNLRVDAGSRVSRGQSLATIEALGVRSQAAGAQAQVAAARANLAVAKQRLDAAETLRKAGAMSEIDYRTAVAGYEAAEAQLAAARAQAAASNETASFTNVVAPISGIVSARRVEGGESVKSGDELLTVVDARMLELAGQIGVADAARVRVGQPVIFTIDAMPGEELRGRVARMDPTADPGTRQVGVYVELPNPSGRIIGGQFARGRISIGASTAVVIPQRAVQSTGGGANAASGVVFVIENGRIARRVVTLGARDEATGMVAVLSGVNAGDRVIATITTDIREGMAVTVAADSAGAATQPATRRD